MTDSLPKVDGWIEMRSLVYVCDHVLTLATSQHLTVCCECTSKIQRVDRA